MDDERRFQQMDELLADFDVETRIRVFEDDVFFRFQESLAVERAADAGFGERVDVGPLAGAGAAGGGVPLLA